MPAGRGGTNYILAILDIFSKYIKLYVLKKETAGAIIKRILNEYIPEVGKPEAVITDNGTQFTSKKWSEKIKELNIKTHSISRYHPQANPVQRYNREVGRILRTYCVGQYTKWPEYLNQIEFWLNRLRSNTTEITPWQVMTGRRPEY